jgi:hypothetical protein
VATGAEKCTNAGYQKTWRANTGLKGTKAIDEAN